MPKNTWTQLFSEPVPQTANAAESGQELTALAGDKTNLVAPTDFAHKSRFTYNGTTYPWYDNVLPAALQGKSSTEPYPDHIPFNIMDLNGGNWTSISSNAN